jgi:phosphotransferase system HPr (HPr) family protein
MIKQAYTMKWVLGMHARPSGMIADFIKSMVLDKAILLCDGEEHAMNGIMSLMVASISEGKQFTLMLKGPDEKKAFEFLDSVFSAASEDLLYEWKKTRQNSK